MLEYHKINSIYMRDPATKHKSFIEDEWAQPEFEYLANAEWEWTEKVDGTNMRVEWCDGQVSFGGRTENAQIPVPLMDRMYELFPPVKMAHQFENLPDFGCVTLFGEGYGEKIQKGGGNYKSDGCDFVLFDVNINGIFLRRETIEEVALQMKIDIVPIVGRGTLRHAVHLARSGFPSEWGDFQAEGLVMRPSCEILTNQGKRIICKVKCRDFLR